MKMQSSVNIAKQNVNITTVRMQFKYIWFDGLTQKCEVSDT